MLDARAILIVSAFALTAAVEAQPRRAPTDPPALQMGPSVTDLLNARRQLGLSSRQVTRLDSIERAPFTQRDALRAEMASRRDSLCANRRPCALSSEERQGLRAQMTGDRARSLWQGDSAGMVLAMSLLDSTQRGRVQGFRMRESRLGGRQGGGRQSLRPRELPRGARSRFRRGPGPDFLSRRGLRPGMRPEFGPWGRGFGPGRPIDPRMEWRWRRDMRPGGVMGPRGAMGPSGARGPDRPMRPGAEIGRLGGPPGDGRGRGFWLGDDRVLADSGPPGTARPRRRPGGNVSPPVPPHTTRHGISPVAPWTPPPKGSCHQVGAHLQRVYALPRLPCANAAR